MKSKRSFLPKEKSEQMARSLLASGKTIEQICEIMNVKKRAIFSYLHIHPYYEPKKCAECGSIVVGREVFLNKFMGRILCRGCLCPDKPIHIDPWSRDSAPCEGNCVVQHSFRRGA